MACILVVDDEEDIRVTLRAFLEEAGYDVSTAEDADVASKLLADGRVDVVVTDIMLPRVSGVELLKTIREASPSVQVIMMTGDPKVETAAAAVRAGAFDYLCKPVSKEAMLRVVGNAAKLKSLDDERLRLLAENKQYQERLEELVRERTHELEESNSQLHLALTQLEEAQERIIQGERMNALGQMASGIAHDFNNALMPIMGHSEYYLAEPEALANRESVLHAFKEILMATVDAREIVRRLREFSRPHDSIECLPVDLNEVVKSAISLTRPRWRDETRAQGHPVDIVPKQGRVPLVSGNEHELRELLTNLILNAVDAMPAGGAVTIRTHADEHAAHLEVEDGGTGMTEAVRRRCFEPFFSTKGEKGTGLGLSMVHGIVRRHGGSIEVDSKEGRGTTFRIRLELYSRKEEAGTTEELRLPGEGASLNILVVDDDEATAKLVASTLQLEGHHVDTAISGREGIERIGRVTYDVLITDRAMDGINGDALAKFAHHKCAVVRVIMLTGFAASMEVRGESPPHVDVILSKPVHRDQLLGAIANVMSAVGARKGIVANGQAVTPAVG